MRLKIYHSILLALSIGLSVPAVADEDPAIILSRANAKIAKASALKAKWDGPSTGPKIGGKKLIAFIGSDFRDNSIMSLSKGLKEAIEVAGWELLMLDCWGVPSKRAEAFSRAMALKPDGIILAGIDANAQQREINIARAKKIPVLGWHASMKIGPADGLFINIGSDPKYVGQTVALLSVIESNGKAGVVLFSDSSNLYSIAKTNEVADVIKHCRTCTLLSVEDLSLGTAPKLMPDLLASLMKRHGKKWTYAIAVNDLFLDLMAVPTSSAIIASNNVQTFSTGDGSESAYKRIRNKAQLGTVPEPFNFHGWQLVDEMNRAIANESPSGYMMPTYLVTAQNIAFHGGPKDSFEPETGFRGEYKKIWGK